MSRRARRQANARPWEAPEALALGPEDDDEQHDEWDDWLPEFEDNERGHAPQPHGTLRA